MSRLWGKEKFRCEPPFEDDVHVVYGVAKMSLAVSAPIEGDDLREADGDMLF